MFHERQIAMREPGPYLLLLYSKQMEGRLRPGWAVPACGSGRLGGRRRRPGGVIFDFDHGDVVKRRLVRQLYASFSFCRPSVLGIWGPCAVGPLALGQRRAGGALVGTLCHA